jgi:hypothetical protein
MRYGGARPTQIDGKSVKKQYLAARGRKYLEHCTNWQPGDGLPNDQGAVGLRFRVAAHEC